MEGGQAAQKPGEGEGAGTDGLSNGCTTPPVSEEGRGGRVFTLSRAIAQR